MNDQHSISVVVLTHNEELNIESCLASVDGWCREVFVVDSDSTDRTLEIVRKYTQLVHHHAYVDHASQWRWALENLPFECEWVLALDADNVVSEGLKRQIAGALRQDNPHVDGYYVAHTHYFRNRKVRGLKKNWLRLIRHRAAAIDDSELVDFRFIVEGETRVLSGDIVESNKKELAIDFWIDKHQKFAARMAAEEVLRRSGRLEWSLRPRILGNRDEAMVWLKLRWYRLPLFVRPYLYFLYRYFLRAGFLDGRNGLVYHTLQAFWFRLLVDIRISEIESELSAGRMTLDDLASSTR